jgi:glycosyltransferase involved in cell wall biosynthesis
VEDSIDVLVQVVHKVYDVEGIKQRTGVKVVMSNHGEPFWQRYRFSAKKAARNPLAWKLYLRFVYECCGRAMKKAIRQTEINYKSCDAYTVLCDSYKSTICRRLGLDELESHIVVIGNSEPAVADVCFDKEKLIMYCGRIYNSTKRVDRLLRIWKFVQDEMPDWKLVIVGDGSDRPAVERQIRDQKIERVSITGWIADVASYYRRASVCCLTSQTESWGLTLTEAQVNGVIPVAFGCSAGVRSILEPSGVNGYIVPPYDEKKYADTLLHIAHMADEQLLELRKNVVAKATEYSVDTVGTKWKDLFDSLVSN